MADKKPSTSNACNSSATGETSRHSTAELIANRRSKNEKLSNCDRLELCLLSLEKGVEQFAKVNPYTGYVTSVNANRPEEAKDD